MQPLYYLWRMVYVVYSFKKGEAPAKRYITNIEAYIILLYYLQEKYQLHIEMYKSTMDPAGRRVAIDYKC